MQLGLNGSLNVIYILMGRYINNLYIKKNLNAYWNVFDKNNKSEIFILVHLVFKTWTNVLEKNYFPSIYGTFYVKCALKPHVWVMF